jgi:hypothetical protein
MMTELTAGAGAVAVTSSALLECEHGDDVNRTVGIPIQTS